MNITNRLYSYPVLSEETDDYKNCSFNVDIEREMSGVEEIEFTVRFNLISETLQRLIKEKYAEFMIHIECSQTAYRHTHRTSANTDLFDIQLKHVNGKIELAAFVVLKKNLKNFKSDEWDEDFDDLSIDLPKGSILAYQNIDGLNITKDFEEFTNPNSIISVVKMHSEEQKASEVNLEADRIQIRMYDKDYENYIRLSSGMSTQELINMATVFPALVYAFDTLKDEENYDKYSGRNWLISLEKAYAERGQDLKEIIQSEKSGYVIAQEALDMPVSKIYNYTHQLSLTENEEED